MPIFVQWTLPALSGLPKDDCVNTFTFMETGTEFFAEIGQLIADFYNTTPSGATFPISSMIGPSISRTAPMTAKFWNISGANVPLGEPDGQGESDTLGTPASVPALPREVSLAMSFNAAMSSGLPARRRRGRIYIGPLIRGASTEGVGSSTGRVGPNGDVTNLWADAGAQLLGGGGAVTHAVWSRAAGVCVPVVRYSCDNAFDTQRRRGEDATGRVEEFVT